jgi:hypothetical protein
MRIWPVVTGVAIALSLVACKSPRRRKACSPLLALMPAAISANGTKLPAWKPL